MTWQDDAACFAAIKNGDAVFDDWFPKLLRGRADWRKEPAIRRALTICETCTVKSECLADVLAAPVNERHGIRASRLFGVGRSVIRGTGRVA